MERRACDGGDVVLAGRGGGALPLRRAAGRVAVPVREKLRGDAMMLRELWATLADAARHGDWRGHLAAWWEVARGDVTRETRI